VLQRIAVCYLFAAAAYKLTLPRAAAGKRARRAASAVPSPAMPLAAVAGTLAAAYYLIMMFVPPPGGAAGDLTPEGNLGAHIDRALMGGHLWKAGWDPEGLLSTIPAVSTTLFGVVAGLWLGSETPPSRKAGLLALAGAAGIAAGYAWHPLFPINKNLWTSSYVLFTAGAAALLLALCYWAIDVKGSRAWTRPFVILGSNAITLFVVSGLLVKTLNLVRVTDEAGRSLPIGRYAYVHYIAPFASPRNASLLYAVLNLAVLFALLAWMYRRRLFLRV
jgi:predicted acyltransferase